MYNSYLTSLYKVRRHKNYADIYRSLFSVGASYSYLNFKRLYTNPHSIFALLDKGKVKTLLYKDLSTLCCRLMGAVTVFLRSLWFKACNALKWLFFFFIYASNLFNGFLILDYFSINNCWLKENSTVPIGLSYTKYLLLSILKKPP